MTIDEAIKTLEPAQDGYMPTANPKALEAVKLGVEALKEIKELRQDPMGYFKDHLLPGETEK